MPAARVSFVVPVLNESSLIASLLRDLRARFPSAELLVVDGGSSDETVREAMSLCDQLLISAPGRALQMNLGATATSADYLFFLHADSLPQLSEEQLVAALEPAPVWGFCPVRLSGSGLSLRVIEWFITRRSRYTSVATGDQMLFVRRATFEELGGFARIPLMEDVALSKRLRDRAPPLVLPWPVVTSSRRWEEGGLVRTVLRMWGLRLAYFLGVNPVRLARYYYGR